MNQLQFRQGDVFVVAVESIPDDATPEEREQGTIVLGDGKATGHKHQIESRDASSLRTKSGERYLRIRKHAVRLFHEEHSPVELPPGNYKIVRQREYESGEWTRQVAD